MKKILEIIKKIFRAYGLLIKYTWRYFDLDHNDMNWEREDYVKAMNEFEKEQIKKREEKESKIFEDKIMK